MAVDERRAYATFMTKTQHYRKITKPLLERKRRARMNLYIDELKDLIVDTMEAQGEHVAKWEKADILEMTVNYLKMQRHKSFQVDNADAASNGVGVGANVNLEKFRAGYTQAAYDVSKIFANLPGLDLKFTTRLMQHLGGGLKHIPNEQQVTNEPTATSSSTSTPALGQQPQQDLTHPQPAHHQQHMAAKALQLKQEVVWRPW